MTDITEKAIKELESLGFVYDEIKSSQKEYKNDLTAFSDKIILPEPFW